MDEKIKNLLMLLLAIGVAAFGYYFYQSYSNNSVDSSDITEEQVNNEEETTTPTANPPAQKTTTSSSNQLPSVTEDGIYLVYYFNDGFSPNVLQLRKGSSVRFINKSDNAMRVFTSNDQEHRFSQLNQSQTVGKNGTYDFTFVDTGLWEYFNYNAQNHKASVLVY